MAAADEADPDHHACAELLETAASTLRASPLVVAEAAYLIGRQLGPAARAGVTRQLTRRLNKSPPPRGTPPPPGSQRDAASGQISRMVGMPSEGSGRQ